MLIVLFVVAFLLFKKRSKRKTKQRVLSDYQRSTIQSFIGKLLNTLILQTAHVLGDNLESILKALLSKIQSSDILLVQFFQLLVFNYKVVSPRLRSLSLYLKFLSGIILYLTFLTIVKKIFVKVMLNHLHQWFNITFTNINTSFTTCSFWLRKYSMLHLGNNCELSLPLS